MDQLEPIIATPRLKLTLITKAERGSQEFQWLHELRSDEKATWWSIFGQSQCFEDTEKFITGILPTNEGEQKTYRVLYAVHKLLGPLEGPIESGEKSAEPGDTPTEFIGCITLRSVDDGNLALPEHLTLPAASAATTLTIELAYTLLPKGWGQGYAAESVKAMFEACKKARSFWAPFSKLYVRAIVNQGNPASMRVMEKIGVARTGIYDWTGKIFLAGKWREEDKLHIYGVHLLE